MSVLLGGDTKTRGIIRTSQMDTIDWILFSISATCAFIALLTYRTILGALIACTIAATSTFIFFPINIGFGDISLSYLLRTRMSYTWRKRKADEENIPGAIGSISLEEKLGFGIGCHHTADAKLAYYTLVVETQGLGKEKGGAWQNLLTHAASSASPISHFIQTMRITAWDSSDHVAWASEMIENAGVIDDLVNSYAEVIDDLADIASNTRCWLTIRIPALRLKQSDPFGEAAQIGHALMERAGNLGIAMRPLSLRRRAALMRHLFNPEYSPDDVRGVDEKWDGVWGRWTVENEWIEIKTQAEPWRLSTWETGATSITPTWLPTDFLYPLTVGLPGSLIRTIIVATELEDIRRARRKAIEDVTSDVSALIKDSSKITDGENESQALASQIRRDDLAPGSGAAGVKWSMAIAFHSHPSKWEGDKRAIAGALEDCFITLPKSLHGRQDQAATWLYALGLSWKEGK